MFFFVRLFSVLAFPGLYLVMMKDVLLLLEGRAI